MHQWVATWVFLVLGAAAVSQSVMAQTQIANTVHNLTPGGPGELKETRPTGLCVFCHTPHNGNPTQGLWNRELPAVTYQLYTSSTLQAVLNQPTGSSRLCLSCHDGILAMGALKVPPAGDPLELGRMTTPRALGTDLSDDHPISFVYDSTLAMQRAELADPAGIPSQLRLDAGKQMQCTTCHDPHEDRRPKFLRMDNADGSMCLGCHRLTQWNGSSHATSPASWKGIGVNPWPENSPPTVGGNACNNCHRTHSAGHGPRLLAWPVESDNCTVCHAANVAMKDVAGEFTNAVKYSRHPIDETPWVHDPRENPQSMSRHVTCADCHNAHAADSAPANPPIASGRLRGVSGVSADGSYLREATSEYEVCNKCHGYSEPNSPGIVRQDSTRIVRTKIDPSNASFHPIAAVGRNPSIQGLVPGYSASTRLECTSCHDNDEAVPGSIAPRGPHASRYAPILARQYQTSDPTPESYTNYELCYQCHDRSRYVAPQADGFPHAKHVVDQQTPCAACHDSHGSRQNAHLINFMLRDSTGKQVVMPSATGLTEYLSTGIGRGTCSLSCHGSNHDARPYPN